MSSESANQKRDKGLYLDVVGDQSAATQRQQELTFLTTYLDDKEVEKGAEQKCAALVVMVDGMAGDTASQISASVVATAFNKTFVSGYARSTPADLLRASLDDANTALGEAIQRTQELKGMACTLVGAALSNGTLHWASVGDSHLCLIRDREIRKLNDDHSYGGYLARLQAQGVDLEPDADISTDMLMSAVTGEAISEVDCREHGLALLEGDRLIIATPGFASLDDNAILKATGQSSNAKECVAALLSSAKSAAKPNPIGVVVVDVLSRNADSKSREPATEDANAPAPTTVQAAPNRASRRFDMLVAAATALIFFAAAAGSWYGIGILDQWRRPAVSPRLVSAATSELPAISTATQSDAAPGLSFGAPPPLGPTSPSSLSFGAPAPLVPTTNASAEDAAPSKSLRTAAGELFRDPLASGGEGPLMAPIPGGRFQMGGGPTSPAQERPSHTVTVASFALGRFEVTVAEYERFARATGRKMANIKVFDKRNSPITGVSWDDAFAYSRWLSEQTKESYRLPSEAEWEYAARGGVSTVYWWGRNPGVERAHCQDCKSGLDPQRATRVGRFAANAFTLHDTAGNVAEWVHDCWHPNYNGAPNDGRTWEGGDCTLRVVRGGSFNSKANDIRANARSREPSTQGKTTVGFRVARDLKGTVAN